MIDSLDLSGYPVAYIQANIDSKDLWDLDESHGIILETSQPSVDDRCYRLLNLLYHFVIAMKIDLLEQAMERYPSVAVFIETPCTLQEINIQDNFEGMNKPKDIKVVSSKQRARKVFRRDNEYRASRRHIMLQLRTRKNSIRSFRKILKLLLHECAHTMCNHCTFRDKENHESDFDQNEALLKQICENSPNLIRFQEKIIQDIY